MNPRLLEKLKGLGLSADGTAAASPKTPTSSKHKQLTFQVFFPLPPYEGVHFNALEAGQGAYNFTGLLLGVGGRQLQKIKQESGARVEVMNDRGNLHGAHPDPLDEHLHALVTADSLAKLQRAVDLVTSVLAPTNASYQPFSVQPGGSTRLVVMAGPKCKNEGAAHIKLSAKPRQQSSSKGRARASMDGSSTSSSSSSCSTRGMPPSPLLTPVTPAATGSRQGSMFALGTSDTGSCCSSRPPTPSPCTHNSSSSRSPAGPFAVQAEPGSSSHGGSAAGSASKGFHLADFQLPPAALPAVRGVLFAAEEWPALPASQVTSSTNIGSGHTGSSGPNPNTDGVGSSHSSSSSSSKQTAVRQLMPVQQQVQGPGSDQMDAAGRGSCSTSGSNGSRHASSSSKHAAGPVCATTLPLASTGPSGAAVAAGAGLAHAAGQAATATETAAACGSDSAPQVERPPVARPLLAHSSVAGVTEHSMLSPLTPKPEQPQQASSPHEQQQQWCAGVGADAAHWSSSCAGNCGVLGSSLAPEYGFSHGSGSSMPGVPGELWPCPASQFEQAPQLLQVYCCNSTGDLDLLLLRQRAGLVAQACLHCETPAVCACEAPSVPPVLHQPYTPAGDGCGGVLASAGCGEAAGSVGGSTACWPQEYQLLQQEWHMRMAAEGMQAPLMVGAGGGPLPQGYAQQAACSVQTAAVAAAASSAFGEFGLDSRCWRQGDGAVCPLTSLMPASNSIW